MSETKKCPHCFTDIDSRATFCPNCSQTVKSTPEAAKKPVIGLIAMIILVVAVVVSCGSFEFGAVMFIVGGGLLAYAMVTGNLKFWG